MADKFNNIFELDDGTRELNIVNKFGEEICKIHIRTGDISIIDRYNTLLDDFDKIVEPLSGISMKEDGTSSIVEEWDVIKNVEKNLVDRISAIFDSKDISNLFKNRNAFSTINGQFYAEKVIEMLGNIVAQEIAAENEKSQKRMAKYTKDIDKK